MKEELICCEGLAMQGGKEIQSELVGILSAIFAAHKESKLGDCQVESVIMDGIPMVKIIVNDTTNQ